MAKVMFLLGAPLMSTAAHANFIIAVMNCGAFQPLNKMTGWKKYVEKIQKSLDIKI